MKIAAFAFLLAIACDQYPYQVKGEQTNPLNFFQRTAGSS
jgi:hypothetical protein